MRQLIFLSFALITIISCKKTSEKITDNPPLPTPLTIKAWPTFQGNNQHTGFINSPMNILGNQEKILETIKDIRGLVFDDNTIYVPSNDSTLYAIKKSGHTIQWQTHFDIPVGDFANGFLSADESSVYITLQAGKLIAFDKTIGTQKWIFNIDNVNDNIDDVIDEACISDGDIVYVASRNDNLYAVNKNTGIEQWHFTMQGSASSTPSTDANRVYIGDRQGILYAINKQSKIADWQVDLGTRISHSAATIDGDILYIGVEQDNNVSKLIKVNKNSGAIVWQSADINMAIHTTPLIDENHVYFTSGDGKVYAINKQDGVIKWNFNTGTLVPWAGMAVDANSVYTGSVNGKISIIDKLSGKLKKQINVGTADQIVGLAIDGKGIYAPVFSGGIPSKVVYIQ